MISCRVGIGLVLLLLFGCACGESYPDAAVLVVDFSWKQTQNCSDISPELNVQGLPEGTNTIDVDMWDLTNSYHHGGGQVANDGTGVIPAGALKEYQGPCPTYGSPKYEFTVKALDKDGRVLGIGKKMKRFPPVEEDG